MLLAVFSDSHGRIGPMTAAVETYRPDRVLFLGDGVPVFRKTIEDTLGGQALFAPSHVSRQRAASVAALGAELLARGETVTPAAFAPFYLRISQAERERNARLRQEG